MTQPEPTPGDPAPTTEPTNQPTEPGDPADKPLGPAGESALKAEREARKALEKQLAPLLKLAETLGAGTPAANGKSEVELLTERLTQHETELATERQARWRAEVAAEKGLPTALAARLQGATREELAADADALKALIPAEPTGPRTPAPDPTQGARGPVDIDALIRDAETKGDVRTAIRLKNQKLHAK